MPYKDPKDKVNWRKRNKEANREYSRVWRLRQGFRPMAEIKEAASKKAEKRNRDRLLKELKKKKLLDSPKKKCSRCAKTKLKKHFGPRLLGSIDGLRAECNPCLKEKYRKYREGQTYKLNRQKTYWARYARFYSQRERDLGLIPIVTAEIIERIYNKFKNKCFNCGSSHSLCLDHHNPKKLGFVLSEANGVLLCRGCNSAKQERHPSKFYTKAQLKVLLDRYCVATRNV